MSTSIIHLTCDYCSRKFVRRLSEHNRCQRRGMKSFCSRSCACIYGNKTVPRGNVDNLCADNRRDDFTPFRWFLLRARYRATQNSRKQTNLDLNYLKELWEQQEGICPITGWKLLLPDSANGWRAGRNTINASLDRIDASQGYIRNNVRFVSVAANIARSQFTDGEFIKFCQAVVQHKLANKEQE